MKSYTSKKTEIRKSKKQGNGFFAIDNILKNEIVAIRSGHIVESEEAMRLDKEVGDFSLQISDNHFLCPKSKDELENIAIYINHSCDPNVGMDGQITYVAMRDIKANEELCIDYAMAWILIINWNVCVELKIVGGQLLVKIGRLRNCRKNIKIILLPLYLKK